LIRTANLAAKPGVSLKGQCQESHFYGKDLALEKMLSEIEGELASLLKKFDDPIYFPAEHTPERSKLISHISVQWSRTRVAADRTNQMASEYARLTVKDRFAAFLKTKEPQIPQDYLDSFEFGLTDPVKTSLGHGILHVIFLTDLAIKIMTAATGLEFITSDNPVIMTNPFFLGTRPGCVTGLNARGLVVLFPLSPQSMAVLYDPLLYKVGPGSKNVFPAEEVDMVYVNNLQFLNAGNVTFVKDSTLIPALTANFSKVAGYRRKRLHSGRIVETKETPTGRQEYIRFSNEDIRYAPPVSFLKAKKVGEVAFGYRDPLLRQLHEQFMVAVEKGYYQLSEFAEFMEIDARRREILP
jgi:hypothetical protein